MAKSTPARPKFKLKINKAAIAFAVFVVAWAGLSLTASQLFLSIILSMLLGEALSEPLWTLVFYILSYALTFFLILYVPPKIYHLYFKKHKLKKDSQDNLFATNPEELGMQNPPTLVDVGLAPVGYVVYIIISAILTNLMATLFSWFNASQDQNVGFSYFLTSADRIYALLAVVFVAPIAEEIIMRGWLYGKLRSRLKVVWSILLTSVLFGFLHGQWNIAISTFALSVVLCILRELTGTIWSGMLLHILSNGIAFYLVYIAGIGA